MLKGTEYGISREDWEESTFFFETSEDKPSPEYVECALISYGISGAWDRVKNLIIAKPRGYSPEEYKSLEEKVISVIRDKFNIDNINIITNADIGHTQPMLVFPICCKLKMSQSKKLTLTESPFK